MIFCFLHFLCYRASNNFIREQKDILGKQFKGTALEALKAMAQDASSDDLLICQMLKKGEKDKLIDLVKKVNKHVNEATKIRFGLMTAMSEGLKSDSKMTIPDVLW